MNNKNDERNKTPENKSIFNPVKPNLLIESFKKELENKSNMIKLNIILLKNNIYGNIFFLIINSFHSYYKHNEFI